MPAVAVTDTGNLFGALEFAQTAQKEGVQPIVGCQLQVTRELPTRESGEPRNGTAPAPDQLVLLVQNETGYRNLMRLVSCAFLESEPSEEAQVSIAVEEGLAAGLLALTGGTGGAGGGRPPAEQKEMGGGWGGE